MKAMQPHCSHFTLSMREISVRSNSGVSAPCTQLSIMVTPSVESITQLRLMYSKRTKFTPIRYASRNQTALKYVLPATNLIQ